MKKKSPEKRTSGGATMEAMLPRKSMSLAQGKQQACVAFSNVPVNEPNDHTYTRRVCVHVQRTIRGLTLWAKAVKTHKQLAPITILLGWWRLWHRATHCYNKKPRRIGAQERVYVHCAKHLWKIWSDKLRTQNERKKCVCTWNRGSEKHACVMHATRACCLEKRLTLSCAYLNSWHVWDTFSVIISRQKYVELTLTHPITVIFCP